MKYHYKTRCNTYLNEPGNSVCSKFKFVQIKGHHFFHEGDISNTVTLRYTDDI